MRWGKPAPYETGLGNRISDDHRLLKDGDNTRGASANGHANDNRTLQPKLRHRTEAAGPAHKSAVEVADRLQQRSAEAGVVAQAEEAEEAELMGEEVEVGVACHRQHPQHNH